MAVYNPGAGFIGISSRYGDSRKKTDEETGKTTYYGHEGDDWAADLGTPIPAAADGEVILTPWDKNGYGHYIVLKHTDQQNKQVLTIYGQMRQKSTLALNTLVKKGDIVGYVGMTGESSRGSHLHFEIRLGDFYDRKIVDPSTYDLSQLKSLEEPAQSSPAANSDDQINPEQQTSGNDQADTTANTAQDEQDINSYATPTACTEDQFIVQIMGKDHPEAQRVILVDDKNNVIEPDNKNVVIDSSEQSLLSTLHTWDWCKLQDKKDKLKAYLEIKTSDKPIRILLSEQINKTERQIDKQHNQIVPIVPTTLVGRVADFNYDTSFTEFITNLGVPVVARPGYLYIHKNEILSREVKIIAKDQDTIAFKDVPIEQYRQGDKFDEDKKREATGVELSEIWIASCWNETDIQNMSFIYSEVQLSGARLNFLRENKAEFDRHPKTIPTTLAVEKTTHQHYEKDILKGHELLANFSYQKINWKVPEPTRNSGRALTTINLFKKQIIATNLISPHRMRDVLQETTLDNPAKYLYDQDETFFETAMQLAKNFEDDNRTGKAQFYNLKGSHYQLNRQIRDLEFTAWAQEVEARKQPVKKTADELFCTHGAFISILNKERPVAATAQTKEGPQTAIFSMLNSIESPISGLIQDMADILSKDCEQAKPTTLPSMWENAPAFKNVLQDAQDREIYSVYVDDIMYSNRHLVTNINNTAQQLRSIVDQASQQDYFDSALIIQQIVAPEKLGDKPNDLRETLRKKLDKEGKQKLAVACSATGRAALVTKYSELQGKLCAQFQSTELLETLADHLSQDNQVHYTAAYINSLRSILSFALPPQQIDPYLSPDGRVYYGVQKIGEATNQQQGLAFLTTLVESLDDQLHKMLFKPVDLEAAGRSLTDEDKNKETPNFGNGYIRPNILNKCLTDKKEATEEDTENLDAALLVLEFAKTEDETIKRVINFSKDLAGVAASAFNNIDALVKHYDAQEKAEVDNNKTIRDNIQAIDDEIERLKQQKQAIDAERQRIASEKTASIYNETIAMAEETSKQAEQLLRENEQRRAELERKLPQVRENAEKARQVQSLEQQQQQHDQKILATNQEITTLQERHRALQQANADQKTLADCQRQIADKQAELARLKAQAPTQTASNTANAHIKGGLNNTSNNGQARAGTVNLHELPISLWRLVMFDHTRHILGGLIAEAYIAPFERRIQGPGNNVRGVLIRFPNTPEAKTLLSEVYGDKLNGNKGNIYGDVINADYEVEASTNRDKVGRQNNTNLRKDFLAIFAPEGSDLHQFIQALEEEALAGRAERYAQASTEERVKIAENHRNRAQANLEARQGREQALKAEIDTLEAQKQTLQNNVDKTITEHGQLQEQGATAEQLTAKTKELQRQQQLQTANNNRIAQLTADLGLEGAYQNGLRALIDAEQATIDQLQEAEKRSGTLQQTKDQADQTAATEHDRILEERNKRLAQAQADLDKQIAQHSADYDQIKQQKPQYELLQENLASSERVIAGARREVVANTRNLSRLDWLVDNQAFRGSVLIFQAYNLINAIVSYKQMWDERNWVYASATTVLALGNVGLAAEDIIANSSWHRLEKLRDMSKTFRTKVWFEIPRSKVPSFLANSPKVILNLKVTTMVIAQVTLSVVAIGLTGADLWHSICKNEKGIITFAKGLAFLGSLVGFASIFIGGAAPLLLNPLGWVALLLTLAAFAIIWVFSRTPLEAWIEYGPFSASPKSYLKNETEAFYRLVGIYTDVQITIDNNPDVNITDPQNREDVELYYQNQKITFTKIKLGQRIRITSQLSGLMTVGKNTIDYKSEFRLKVKRHSMDNIYNKMLRKKLNFIENDLPNGKEYLLDKVTYLRLYGQTSNGVASWNSSAFCSYLVDCQILVKYNNETLAFPALRADNDEDLSYTQATTEDYNSANFERDFIGETHRPFWANETSHLAKPGKAATSPQKTEQASADDIILSNNAGLA